MGGGKLKLKSTPQRWFLLLQVVLITWMDVEVVILIRDLMLFVMISFTVKSQKRKC